MMLGKLGIPILMALWAFPWVLRRVVLAWVYGWDIARDARIGWSVLLVRDLHMGARSRVGHLTFIRLDECRIGSDSKIGHRNWISGFPKGNPLAFTEALERRPRLVIAEHASITHSHRIDCTDEVIIGAFTTVAG